MTRRVLPAIFGIVLLLLACGKTPGDYAITPVPFTQVKLDDAFWSPRMETNQKVTLPYAYQQCEETGRIANFAVAGGVQDGHHVGYRFNDSDVYKIIEGAAYALHLHPDSALAAETDRVIDLIAAAQEEDGYLYTAKTALNPDAPSVDSPERWQNIRDDHELYCAGHLYEAAVAYYQATGKRKLLDVALRNADLVDSVFGPDKLRYPSGHEEIEIGLARLYRITGEARYLKLAQFFLDQRGDSTGHALYGEYAQDHMPVVKQRKAVGHAVRAAYLYTGMADIAALTGNKAYVEAIQTIWKDVAGNKLYVTGGIGASGGNEGFAGDYNLPNASAYSETCASIANAMWNHRLFLMTGNPEYMDLVEKIIYNGFLSGIAMEGDRFFYPNRLQSYSGAERSPWFACACCPSNVVRFLPSLPGYAYAHRGKDLYVNLFMGGQAEVVLSRGTARFKVETRYPWEGDVVITLQDVPAGGMTLNLRVPGWAQGQAVPGDLYRFVGEAEMAVKLTVNGEAVDVKPKKGYLRVSRDWQSGDKVVLTLPLPVRRVVAHDSVAADVGRVAVQRGPLIYCAEGIDNAGGQVRHLVLDDRAPLAPVFVDALWGGVTAVKGRGQALFVEAEGQAPVARQTEIRLIPYYAWAHRGKTEMAVWLARTPETAMPSSGPTLASQAQVTASAGRNPEALSDGLVPATFPNDEIPRYHWWPRKGQTQWVQYTFDEPQTLSRCDVMWFDDTGEGECRVPESWRVLYEKHGAWLPVPRSSGYPIILNAFNTVTFGPVTTRSLRLETTSPHGFAGGIYEWSVK